MADSPTAQHRTRLIRNMARELKRPSQSASNRDVADGSSVWDPDNEAWSSTNISDTTNTTQRLPSLRDSAKKYRTYTRPAEPSIEINTSMMRDAFPDFSQGAIVTEDGGSSIELGRARNRTPSITSNTSGNYHLMGEQPRRHISASSLRTPSITSNTSGNYHLMGEQPRRHISASKKTVREGSEDLRREAMARRASDSPRTQDASYMSTSKVEDHGSDGSRNSSGRYRRPLAETQARVRADDDASQLSENQSENLTLNVRRTRFGGRKNNQNNTSSDIATNEVNMEQDSESRRVHTPVEDVVAQDEEQAIVNALNHLYERVETLESDNDSIRQTVTELKSENVVLRADMVGHKQRSASQDTAGMANGHVQSLQARLEEVEGKATAAEATIEALTKDRDSARYQISIMTETGEDLLDKIQLLEEQRDDFKRKLAALKERYDQESQQWKSKQEPKNDVVPRSHSTTKRVGGLDLFDDSFRFVSGTTGPIRSTSDIRDSEAIKNAFEKSVEDCESESNNSTVLHHVVEEEGNSIPQEVSIGQVEDKEPKALQPSVGVTPDLTYVSNADTNNLVVLRKDLEDVRVTRPQQPSGPVEDCAQVEDCRQKDTVQPAVSVHTPSVPDASGKPGRRTSSGRSTNARLERPQEPSYHFDYIRRDEILKKVAESKAKWDVSSKSSSGNYSAPQTEDSQLSSGTVIRRRPSEQLTSAFLIPDITFEKVPVPSAVEAPEPSKRPVSSPLVQQLVVSMSGSESQSRSTCKHTVHRDGCDSCQAKRAGGASNATSVSTNNKETPPVKARRTSRSSQSSLDNHSSYHANNKPVREASHVPSSAHEDEPHHDGHGPTHLPSHLPINARPQPANVADSEASDSSQYEEEPTMRPSQHPGVALATVMKGLKMELREIKRELALRQKAYSRQDPTLAKRKRHQLREAIETLVRSAETQADRIYALQDVLEGQKSAGQAMRPEELEETLQSIGIDCDVSALSLGEN